MRFSIITPTFNSDRTIATAISSVINQSFHDYEHVIVDNVSTDTTLEIIQQFYSDAGLIEKVVIISEKDKGISDAFNKGIRFARGEYILILNSDDCLNGNTVLADISETIQVTKSMLIHGDMLFEDTVFGSNRRKPLFCKVEAAMPFNHPGMFIHRDLYKLYGGYDLRYSVAMDYELILRFDTKIEDFLQKTFYFTKYPLTITRAGGASWVHEQKGIDEVRTALKRCGRYNYYAMYHFYIRTFRTKLKAVLKKCGMASVVVFWRKVKWSN